ncbi:MAG: hypothetical protein KC563_09495 [Nitrospira sp.]|nr:hypothetical protein [Nitrospira sp.]
MEKRDFPFKKSPADIGLGIGNRDFDPQDLSLFAAQLSVGTRTMPFGTWHDLDREDTRNKKADNEQFSARIPGSGGKPL